MSQVADHLTFFIKHPGSDFVRCSHWDTGSNHDPKHQTTGHFEVPKIWGLVMNGWSSCWFLEFHNGSIFGGIWWLPSAMLVYQGKIGQWLIVANRAQIAKHLLIHHWSVHWLLLENPRLVVGHNPTRHSSVYVLITSSCGERPALGSTLGMSHC